jgi:hypothetical protein
MKLYECFTIRLDNLMWWWFVRFSKDFNSKYKTWTLRWWGLEIAWFKSLE